MCPRHHIQAKDGNMSKVLWRRIIDDIARTAPDTIILPFWRGESLLHPDFIELIEYALNKALRIHISTNGILAIGEYATILSRCEFVTFSIHTEGGYENAKDFLCLKKSNKHVVQVSFVKGEKTETILQQIINSSNLCGFDNVRLYDEHTKNGIFGKSDESDLKKSRIFCPKLINTLVIAYDGTISRCNHIWETEKELNLLNMDIRDVWNSIRLFEIRKNYPDQFCEPCDQWIGHTLGESWQSINGNIEHKIFEEK